MDRFENAEDDVDSHIFLNRANSRFSLRTVCLLFFGGILLCTVVFSAVTGVIVYHAILASVPPTSPNQDTTSSINLSDDVIRRLNSMEEKLNSSDVAFMATLSEDLTHPTTGSVVVFDKVHTNKGDDYNPRSGVFTAPLNGTYYFSVVTSVPHEPIHGALQLFVMKNEVRVALIFLDGTLAYWLRRNTDTTISLLEGDSIKVMINRAFGGRPLAGGSFRSHFSGFLIHADFKF